MRIAYLVNQYPKVSHTFIRREIRALEEHGVEVLRYSVRRVGEPLADPADLEEQGKTRFVLDAGPAGLATAMASQGARRPAAFARATAMATRIGQRSDRGLAYHGAYLGEACIVRDWAEEDGVEHIHTHFGTNSATVAMLCQELGGPGYSLHIHGPLEFDRPLLLHLGEKIERSRFACAVSSFGKSQLYRQVAYEHWDKCKIVRCGVDVGFLQGDGRPFPEVPELVSVGRLSEQKGQMLLVEALGAVAKAGHDFHLTLVGDGELRGEVEAAIARHDLRDKVTITGWASGDEVREHILKSRAMILPSFAEGLPVVIMEAFGLERPVLSTYIAGIPELVEPSKSGWLIPAGSVDALTGAITEVLETPTERLVEMGQAGRAAVLERHDVRKTSADLKALLARHVR